MQLRSIHLKNYRKYRSQSIDFPSGIIGIVGKNGSGKSTLIEAIGWCLYGNTAARTGGEEIRTTGVEGEDCSVTLEFVLDSDAVKVVRELKGKNALVCASVFLNGDTKAQVRGAKEVSDYIAKRTGMDRVAFFASVFAQQKELNAFSELRPGDRKKTIMRLLRIDRIDEALSVIRVDVRKSGDRIQMLKGNLKDMDELRLKQKQTAKEKRQTDVQIIRHNKITKQVAAAEKKAKANFSAHEEKYRRHNATDKRLTGIVEKTKSKETERKTIEAGQKKARVSERKLLDMQPQLDEYDVAKRRKEDLDVAYGRFKEKGDLNRQHTSMVSEIGKTAQSDEQDKKNLARMRNLDSKQQNQEDELSGRKIRVAELTKQISDISAVIKGAKKQKREYEANLTTMERQGQDGTCPTCKRPLRDHLPLVSKLFTDHISKLEKEIHANLRKKERLESRLQSAKDAEERISERIKRLTALIGKRTSLQDKLENSKKHLEFLEKEESKL